MTTTLIAAALECAAQGHPVFPVKPGRKEPLTVHGLHDATTDPEIIRAWWRDCPGANIGMPTGSTSSDVLDIDNHGEDGNGFGALRRIRDAGLATGAHRLVQTPRGGLHLYFRPTGNRNGSIRNHHIDCRGDGGYVLVPPSVVNWSKYELLEDRPDATGTLAWDDIKLMLNPPRRHLVSVRNVDPGNIDALVRWLSGIAEGGRNNALFWACCTAAQQGADIAPLIDTAVSIGLTEREAEATARSALRRCGQAS